MTEQLTLRFPRDPAFRGADLLPNPAQDEALAWLARGAEWPMRRLVLWGDAGCGKSHLLHVWAEAQRAPVLHAPTSEWPATALALDCYDRVSDEVGLLHMLNAAHEAGQAVLLAGRVPPGRLAIGLPDLASRLRATTAVEIAPPPDELLRTMLAAMLSDRQLRLPREVADWLLTRLPRHPAALRAAVARLEDAAGPDRRSFTQRSAAAVLGFRDRVLNAGE